MLSAIRTSLSRLSSPDENGEYREERKISSSVNSFVAFDDVVAQTVEEQNQKLRFRGARSS